MLQVYQFLTHQDSHFLVSQPNRAPAPNDECILCLSLLLICQDLIQPKNLDIKCIHHWALVHGLVGLLRNENLDASEIDTPAGNAMGLVRSDIKSFLISALEA